ncbi:hypothetical protein GAYE_PCTG71G1545 [Galdieria yellowstonensis]|jgi:hypothetical protein|uniref:MICOS complex subunit MIC10 n=1 Tax=Galdieria yellowstonensis TaxID=3028027 RepID=A0AAV9I8K7_9RHOD|nr:hypothetical protein GAYE_PCTG71G1545 [Galdieria yellowstonensis]
MGESSSELKVAETWDRTLELGIKRVAYGVLVGSVTALILFRSPLTRVAVSSFGGGVGFGMTYSDAKRDFEKLKPAVSSQGLTEDLSMNS